MKKLGFLAVILLILPILIVGCTNQIDLGKTFCNEESDCVAEQCCHPTSAVNKNFAPDCRGLSCSEVCLGPLDCGTGEIKCINSICTIKPSNVIINPENPPIEPKCGDNTCDLNEKQYGSCPKDCGGVARITKKQCEISGGNWNDCGSPCLGVTTHYCIQVCSAQCECGGAADWKCPYGFTCRLTGNYIDELGVCV
ncbi:MAG: hypothetical protein NT139_01720 [Candidatus Woesearchaeota archaeon]|nr:hypothetical protein [Candidatus Woesearchaeota archaeon]